MKSPIGTIILWILLMVFMSFSSVRNSPSTNDTPVLILVEGGEFEMGKRCEDMGIPVKRMKLESFKISQKEITCSSPLSSMGALYEIGPFRLRLALRHLNAARK